MSTGGLSAPPILQFFGNNGALLVGGQLLTEVGGIPTAVYEDQALTTPLPNPIILNARGEVATSAGASSPLFMEPNTTYSFTLSDAAGNQIWVSDNMNAISIFNTLAAGTGITLTPSGGTITIAATVDLTPYALLSGAAFTGGVSITGNLTVSGTGNFNTSALRFKENVEDIEPDIAKFMRIRPIQYDHAETKEHTTGFSAENIYELYPELVHLDDEGRPYALNYQGTIPHAVKIIQNLLQRVESLERIIEAKHS